ncbi:MAG: hypothetical protein RLZZ306_2926, partial [Bacteroidota bacterium]
MPLATQIYADFKKEYFGKINLFLKISSSQI